MEPPGHIFKITAVVCTGIPTTATISDIISKNVYEHDQQTHSIVAGRIKIVLKKVNSFSTKATSHTQLEVYYVHPVKTNAV